MLDARANDKYEVKSSISGFVSGTTQGQIDGQIHEITPPYKAIVY